MIRRLIGTALLIGGATVFLAPATPALAGGGPSDYADCAIMADPTTFEAGATVTVVGDGFQPNFETSLDFRSVVVVIGTVTTDANGAFTTEVTIPTDAVPGPHSITALCDADRTTATTTVTVSSGGVTATTTTTGGGPLPRTGSDIEPYVVAGAAALVAGVALVLVAKRRRRSVV